MEFTTETQKAQRIRPLTKLLKRRKTVPSPLRGKVRMGVEALIYRPTEGLVRRSK